MIPAPFRLFAIGCLLCCGLGTLQVRGSSWTDLQGTTFKGDPDSVFGPFALFDTGGNKGRRVMMRMLSTEDCARFYKEIAGKAPRAEVWSKSSSWLGGDLVKRLNRVKDGDKIELLDFEHTPEPEAYILIYASSWEGPSYKLTDMFRPTYERLKRLYGDKIEAVQFGIRQDEEGTVNLAKATKMPWPFAKYDEQGRIDAFQRYAPGQGFAMVLITRTGIPLAYSNAENLVAVKRFCDETCSLMAACDEQNHLFWADRARYLGVVRSIQHAADYAPPQLIGTLLRDASLRKQKLDRFSATLEIDAEGKVTAATIKDAATLSPGFVAQLQKVLQTASLFIPAIKDGKPVAATYDFTYTVQPPSAASETDRSWVFLSGRKEVPIPSWLVLRPIPYPKGDDAWKSSNPFNTDFFADKGPGGLAPAEGQTQDVEGKAYTWQRVDSQEGFVNLRNNADCDNSVAYAWAEFDSGAAGMALLGVGSDEGIKIWLNGVEVLDRWTWRNDKVDEDVVPLQLVAGKNRILVKSQNSKEDWDFLLRIRH